MAEDGSNCVSRFFIEEDNELVTEKSPNRFHLSTANGIDYSNCVSKTFTEKDNELVTKESPNRCNLSTAKYIDSSNCVSRFFIEENKLVTKKSANRFNLSTVNDVDYSNCASRNFIEVDNELVRKKSPNRFDFLTAKYIESCNCVSRNSIEEANEFVTKKSPNRCNLTIAKDMVPGNCVSRFFIEEDNELVTKKSPNSFNLITAKDIESSICVSRFFIEEDNELVTKKSLNRFHFSTVKYVETSQNLSQCSIESDIISLSQRTKEEQEPWQEPIGIQPFYNITPRTMPISPHYIFEEEFSSNPWALLVVTIFLQKTTAKTARRYVKTFFEQYPTPYHVLDENPATLERFFDHLGFRKRGTMIWKMTYQFVSSKWRRASDLYGIGKYGEDAYRIFCLGHTDLDPSDRYLKLYLDWLRGHTEFLQDNAVMDSECVIEDPVLKYYSLTLRDKE